MPSALRSANTECRRNADRLNAKRRKRADSITRHTEGRVAVNPDDPEVQISEVNDECTSQRREVQSNLEAGANNGVMSPTECASTLLINVAIIARTSTTSKRRAWECFCRGQSNLSSSLRSPLDKWLFKGRRGLRTSLSLFDELQGGTPTVISVSHYHDIWLKTIDDLLQGDVHSWGANLFKILMRKSEVEQAESERTCMRLKLHLDELANITNDLVNLAERVDPKRLTGIVLRVQDLHRKMYTLRDIAEELLILRKEGFQVLEDAERDNLLTYQVVTFL